MKDNLLTNFKKKHPVLLNFILVVIVFIIGCYACLMLIDIFTRHGHEVQVPDVKFLPLEQATQRLDDAGVNWEVDSNYFADFKPGIVVEQTPQGNTKIKSIRKVLLTVNTMYPPKLRLPQDLTSMPGSNGINLLHQMGFQYIETDTAPSEYNGLIIKVSVGGQTLQPNAEVPVNSRIRLTIGDGSITNNNPFEVDEDTDDNIIVEEE